MALDYDEGPGESGGDMLVAGYSFGITDYRQIYGTYGAQREINKDGIRLANGVFVSDQMLKEITDEDRERLFRYAQAEAKARRIERGEVIGAPGPNQNAPVTQQKPSAPEIPAKVKMPELDL